MLLLTLAFGLFNGTNAISAECVPARESINHRHSGQYHRMHPSGNFVLYSSANSIKIVDITDRSNPKEISTPMRAETYPVEGASGGWDLLASPLHVDNKMHYFQLKDVLSKKNDAKSVYSDRENNNFYHSSAELPGSTKDVKKVRTLLYGPRYREYEMRKDARGNFTEVTPGPAGGTICRTYNRLPQPELDTTLSAEDAARRDELQARLPELQQEEDSASRAFLAASKEYEREYNARPRNHSRVEETKRAYEETSKRYSEATDRKYAVSSHIRSFDRGSRYARMFEESQAIQREFRDRSTTGISQERILELSNRVNELNSEMRRYTSSNENYFSNPVLSKDGTLVAAVNNANRISVYRIQENNVCEEIAVVPFSGSKVSFSYPERGRLPKITFTADSGPSNGNGAGAYVYDLNNGQATFIGERGQYARYPGFTRDGRVVYARDNGFEIVDPNQMNGTTQASCVKKRSSRPSRSADGTPDVGEESGGSGAAE